jgi:hypothetical protein
MYKYGKHIEKRERLYIYECACGSLRLNGVKIETLLG